MGSHSVAHQFAPHRRGRQRQSEQPQWHAAFRALCATVGDRAYAINHGTLSITLATETATQAVVQEATEIAARYSLVLQTSLRGKTIALEVWAEGGFRTQ
jgi:hypothetical protein